MKQNLVIDFSHRVFMLRKQHGLSQSALAEKAGLQSNQIGSTERMETVPCLVIIGKLADAFDMTISELFNFPLRTASASPPSIQQEVMKK